MEGTNILPALAAIIPTFLYSIILYFALPKGMISWRKMRKYFGVGLASPLIVLGVYYTFPNILNFSEYGFGSAVILSTMLAACIEECSKFFTFKWVDYNRVYSKNDLPISTMIYAMSAAAGFAIVENFHYAINYGNEVILMRGITANILHLVCGLMMGYFVAKSKLLSKPLFETKSIKLNKVLTFVPKLFFVAIGILIPTLYHTIYNTNLMVSGITRNGSSMEILLLIFAIGIFISHYMIIELVSISKKIKEKNEA